MVIRSGEEIASGAMTRSEVVCSACCLDNQSIQLLTIFALFPQYSRPDTLAVLKPWMGVGGPPHSIIQLTANTIFVQHWFAWLHER
jgi:hypothetical protein